ncbi:hypothetical protein VHEMI06498 [[Torrubiella] hemipterigena]|uniref:Uncharacterized protein n=1 Tax=[Torrubiella] hemipterigena TaxID=1531966 RepID=A0A0A1T0U4_9HYPO|nr:hypothetical protein VHEMI06498 [[Torrubiella] hemipterigena]
MKRIAASLGGLMRSLVYILSPSPATGWEICYFASLIDSSFCRFPPRCRISFYKFLSFLLGLSVTSFTYNNNNTTLPFLFHLGCRSAPSFYDVFFVFGFLHITYFSMRYSLSHRALLAVAASSAVHATLLQPPGVEARNGGPAVSLEPLPENPQVTGKPSQTIGTDCRVTENITVTQYVTSKVAASASSSCDSVVTVTSTSTVFSSSKAAKTKTKKPKSSKTTSTTAQQTSSSASAFRAESVVHSLDHTETIVKTVGQTVAPLAVPTGGTVTTPQDGDEGVTSPPSPSGGGDSGDDGDGGNGGDDDDNGGGDDGSQDGSGDDKPTGRPAESTTIFTSIVPKPAPTNTLAPFPAGNGNSTNPNSSSGVGFPQPTVPIAAAGVMGSTPSIGAAMAVAAGVLAVLF